MNKHFRLITDDTVRPVNSLVIFGITFNLFEKYNPTQHTLLD